MRAKQTEHFYRDSKGEVRVWLCLLCTLQLSSALVLMRHYDRSYVLTEASTTGNGALDVNQHSTSHVTSLWSFPVIAGGLEELVWSIEWQSYDVNTMVHICNLCKNPIKIYGFKSRPPEVSSV